MAKVPGRNKNFIEGPCKIWWLIDGVVKETISNTETNPVPWHVAMWKARNASQTTHKTGKLLVVSCNDKIESIQTKLELK